MTRRRVIGQAPGRDVPCGPSLSGRAGRMLAGLAGMRETRLRELAVFENVLKFWPGKAGKGDAFPMSLAREAAAGFAFAPGETVLLVGRKTAEAFGVRGSFLEWRPFHRGHVAIFPHPSGINTWWNDGGNRRRATLFLRRFLRD